MPFAKGKSGNPGGRPKKYREIELLAQQQTTRCIERLVEIMNSDDNSSAVRACQIILERGWGKPVQSIEGSIAGPSGEMTISWLPAQLPASAARD